MAFQKLSSKHSAIRRMLRRDISHPSVAAAWVAGPWSDCIPCPGVEKKNRGSRLGDTDTDTASMA